jgi:hypothetical protein
MTGPSQREHFKACTRNYTQGPSVSVAIVAGDGWARYVYPTTGHSGGSGSWTEPYHDPETPEELLAAELAYRRVRVIELRKEADALEKEADALQQTRDLLGLKDVIR